MKKFNKKYLKSILPLLVTQAVIFFAIKPLMPTFHLMNVPFDDVIPFIPSFVWIYNCWYPFLFITLYFFYIQDKEKYMIFFFTTAFGTLLCDIFFLIYPTGVIRPDIIGHGLTNGLLKITYYFDSPANCCFPSLHCYFCFAYIYCVIQSSKINKKLRLFIIVLSSLIILSTLFIKQHVLLDAVASLFLAGGFVLLFSNKKVFSIFKKKLDKLF